MNEYLVTKYDPKYRVNGIGIYTRDEWSDICDIGREFEDGVLTREEYEDMVKRYSACAVDILKRANAERMIVSSCEDINNKACRKENDIVSLFEVGRIVRDCLNGDYWCILTDRRSFVHIGDCLYMYIGCDLAPDEVSEICRRYGMFVIERESPYKHIGELIDWMLRDPTIEDQILEKCEKGNKEYICEHFDGELREEKLYAYCVHAKKNKRAQEILLQVVQFALSKKEDKPCSIPAKWKKWYAWQRAPTTAPRRFPRRANGFRRKRLRTSPAIPTASAGAHPSRALAS